jgi:membrane-bound lytic murein transglycosylase D
VAGVEALVVPVPLVAEPLAHTRLYTVRRGDTLVTIADRFGVSLSQLRRWNGIASGVRVDTGRRLHVAEPVAVSASTARHHRTSVSGAKTGATTQTKSPSSRNGQAPSRSKTTVTASSKSRPPASKSPSASSSHPRRKPTGLAKTSSQ